MTRTCEEIVNPRTGQHMIFRQTAADTDGKLLQIETVNPPGPAEPLHVHPFQESSAEVLAGTLHFRVFDDVHVVTAGEKIVIPANTPHHFWNEGPDDARAIQEFRPALRTEDFFETYFALARDDKLGKDGMPKLLQLAVMVPAFGAEARTASPPWPLLRALCWVLAPIARVRGYQAIYPPRRQESPRASSPEPSHVMPE